MLTRALLAPLLATAFAATLFAADPAPAADAENRPPNVIVFLVDDLGWADLGCYGNRFHETPHADALAKSGVRFTDAYAACPVCSPTRASILTGRYPASIGLTDFIKGHWRPYAKTVVPRFHFELPHDETTFAELLKPHGYASGAFGKWHLGGASHHPGTQGFGEWITTSGRHFAPRFRTTGSTPFPAREREYLGDYLTRRAESFLAEHADEPFVLYLPHYAVHIPLEAERRLVAKYERKAERPEFRPRVDVLLRWAGDEPPELDTLLEAVSERARSLELAVTTRVVNEGSGARIEIGLEPETDVVEAQRLLARNVDLLTKPAGVHVETRIAAINNPVYAAMCEHVDESLGRILAKLDELEIADDTIVVFFSDNGGLLARFDGAGAKVSTQFPLRDEKGSLYEGGIRVPCLVRWPGVVKPGTVSAEPISSVDLLPTITEAAGVAIPANVDGRSLVPLLRGEKATLGREAIYWHYPHYHHTTPAGAVRAGRYKLIEFFEDDRLELYDLETDPGETRNLAAALPDKAIELRRLLTTWRQRVGAKMPTPNPNHDPTRAAEWGNPRDRGF